MLCVFVMNGEKQVTGDILFQSVLGLDILTPRETRTDDSVELVFSVGDALPQGPITLSISPSDCADVADFFAKHYIYFWKVLVLAAKDPYQRVMCVVSFSKDANGVAIHLSLDFGAEKMHIETPIDECTLKAMSSVWGVDLD